MLNKMPASPVLSITAAAEVVPHNRTRRSRSIPRKLIREGRAHFVPIYYLALLSDLAREGITNSGSYRFADHIYRMQPSGRGPIGRWLDAAFLNLKATRAFQLRYKRAQATIRHALESAPVDTSALRVLAVPCGLPRDLTELAATLAQQSPALLDRIEYCGMDIDSELLQQADAFTANCGVKHRTFHCGNALAGSDYPPGKFDAIVSTGLGEFLNDAELELFYHHVHAALALGGTFFTSATRYEKRSEAFLRAFELVTQYRTTEDLERILSRLPWTRLTLVQDESGLQTFVTAVK